MSLSSPDIPPRNDALTRRELFKSFGAGVGVGATLIIPTGIASLGVEAVTGAQAGNASVESAIERCEATSDDPGACDRNLGDAKNPVLMTTVAMPVVEELAFRTIPSAMSDGVSRFGTERSINAAVNGPVIAGLDRYAERTRRSVIASMVSGVLSTAGFAAAHNTTPGGFDTKTVPAAQLVGGSIFWGLQRRFGARANMLAHMGHNALIMFLRWR